MDDRCTARLDGVVDQLIYLFFISKVSTPPPNGIGNKTLLPVAVSNLIPPFRYFRVGPVESIDNRTNIPGSHVGINETTRLVFDTDDLFVDGGDAGRVLPCVSDTLGNSASSLECSFPFF